MLRIKIVDISYNIIEDDLRLAPKNQSLAMNVLSEDKSLMATESHTLYELSVGLGMWGSSMFGDVYILGQRLDPSDIVRIFRQLNVIRTS